MPSRAGGFTLAEIAARFGGELQGDGGVRVVQVATLEKALPGQISFLSNPRYRSQLRSTRAEAVILPRPAAGEFAGPRIVADDPYAYFARVSQLLNPPAHAAPGIHPLAAVASALPPSVSVGANAVVESGACIGENVVIGPGCVIGAGARVGADSLLHANVTVYRDCVVGRRAVIHSGAVVGSDGFGFARDSDASWIKIPQIGRVIIGDDVEIGANTTIDRGTLDDTVIEDGVKLDNQIQIAHNCRIGAHTVIAACAGLAGSARIGSRCMIGGAARIMGHITIVDDVVVAAASFVSKSILQAGTYTGQIPSQKHAEWLKNFAHLRHLDALAARIRALEKRLTERENKP